MKKTVSILALGLFGSLAAQAVITDGIVVYYNFETAATGNNAVIPNVTGAGPSATIIGATPSSGFAGDAAWNSIGATGTGNTSDRSDLLVGKSANLSRATAGSTDRIDIPLSRTTLIGATPVAGAGFTISAWYYAAIDPNQAGSQRYFVFEDGTNSSQFDLSFGSQSAAATATQLNMYSYNNGSTGASVQGNVSVNTWHHVVQVFSYDGTNTVMSVYRDGVLQNSTPFSFAGYPDFTAINLGNARDSTGRAWDGMIDEVAVWSRSLSAADALELYQRGVDGAAINGAPYFSVTLDSTPAASGTVSGGGAYPANTPVDITATPNPGYTFSAWTGSFVGQPATFNHMLVANVNATAQFAQDLSDPDNDNLTTFDEVTIYGTNPNNPDSDGDQIPDGIEVDSDMDPKVDDSDFVAFVNANLNPDHAGAIAMSGFTIDRNPGTGQISLRVGFLGSADQSTWQPVDLGASSFSITPVADGWNVTLPAPSSSVDSYILLGNQP